MKASKRILIIDDDIDDREFFCEAVKLKYPEFECHMAYDAIEALEIVDKSPAFDFIFLDLHMPKVDGFQCLQQLKAHENAKNTPVIILSTSTRIQDIETCLGLGASTYLVKRPTMKGLIEMLDNILPEIVVK